MRKLLVVVALSGLSACGGSSGGSSSSASSTPSAPPASTAKATPTETAAPDQSDYYAATSCKIYGDIAARVRSGANADAAASEAFAATGSAGNAADLNGGKWTDLKAAMDSWVQAIPDAARRSDAEKAVTVQCKKVPPSLSSAAGVLPSS